MPLVKRRDLSGRQDQWRGFKKFFMSETVLAAGVSL